MELLIVTGMSGAGKSTVLKILEDIGYFCIDNMPPFLIPKFAEICFQPGGGSEFEKVALGMDIRGGRHFNELFDWLSDTASDLPGYSILFLDATDEALIKRYKETRRNHPLAKNDRVISGIEKERELLNDLRAKSNYIVDTSNLLTRHLKEQIMEIFTGDKGFTHMICTVMSFGFKYGVPIDADLVFDVRFLPNPFYDTMMRNKTGNDKLVRDFVFSQGCAGEFLEKLQDMLKFLIPHYAREGKNQLVIAIGCTGGKHRSVAIANNVHHFLAEHGYGAMLNHRDITNDGQR